MGEYQYYEFQSLDRPLSATAREEMESLSSRVHLTANSASFVYNYTGFRGDPHRLLTKYFDVMLYIANWGSRRIMFRFPADAIPTTVREAFQYADSMEWSARGQYVILDIQQEVEDGFGWVEGEGYLSGIAQMRNDIMRGDYRGLYLAWLMIASQEHWVLQDDEDLTEPPLPAELNKLSPTLQNFIDFFEIDTDLVTAAAKDNNKKQQSPPLLSDYLDKLSDAEKVSFLERLLSGETYLDIVLAKRLRELAGIDHSVLPANDQPRTIRQLMSLADEVEQARLEKERKKAEAARKKHLDKVARMEADYWQRVTYYIEEKRAKQYEMAVDILIDLRDLAQQRGQSADFQAKMDTIYETYPTLRGLHRRMREARLLLS